MWLKLYAALVVLAAISFAASNALLSGPDPDGWWNYVPGIVFYATVLFAVLLPVVVAVQALLSWLVRTFGTQAPNH